jgi:uncharacterized protein YcbK (DUF882 family)
VVELYHVNRRSSLRLKLVDEQGRTVRDPSRPKRIRRFFRCHHTGKEHKIDPRLVRLVYQTGRHWPGKRVEIVSGYRHPTAARNPKSPHMKGLACDFRIRGVSREALRDYVRRTFKNVGVGYYPNSSFVHLDVRKGQSAYWVDLSGPGEDAIYDKGPARAASGGAGAAVDLAVSGAGAVGHDDKGAGVLGPAPAALP